METDYSSIDIIEDSNDLPEEVLDFIFGKKMEEIKKELLSLVQDQKVLETLVMEIDMVVFGEKDVEELDRAINRLLLDEKKQFSVKKIVAEKIIGEIILLVDTHIEMLQEAPSSIQTTSAQNAPSPAQVLESLKARLTQPNTTPLAPRRTTLEKPLTTNQSTEKIIDPYREKPQ